MKYEHGAAQKLANMIQHFFSPFLVFLRSLPQHLNGFEPESGEEKETNSAFFANLKGKQIGPFIALFEQHCTSPFWKFFSPAIQTQFDQS